MTSDIRVPTCEFRCVPARAQDVADVVSVERRAFPEGRWASENVLRDRLALYPRGSWVVQVDAKVVAFATSYPIDDFEKIQDLDQPDDALFNANGSVYFFRSVAVDPAFRRRGIAKLLTERRLEVARELGTTRACFTGTEDLTTYYTKMGFNRITPFEPFHSVPQAVWSRSC